VRAVELVTADGEHRRVDAEREPELFWALRGGGGSFGVVTALELQLVPVSEVYAGGLMWPIERAREILTAYREWAATVPDEVTSIVRLLHLPPLPMIPEPIRGKSWVAVEAAFLGGEADGAALLAPLRELAPAIDTFASMSAAGLGHVHGDPEGPVPSAGDHALLAELADETIDTIVALVGADSGTRLLGCELRQLGGSLGREAPDGGALARLDGAFTMFTVGMAMDPEQAATSERQAAAVVAALAPWSNGKRFLNFDERPGTAAKAFGAGTYARLRDVKSAYDPEDLFRSNHPVEPAA
jgi:FAD/FMN-containing dehydrogenase